MNDAQDKARGFDCAFGSVTSSEVMLNGWSQRWLLCKKEVLGLKSTEVLGLSVNGVRFVLERMDVGSSGGKSTELF